MRNVYKKIGDFIGFLENYMRRPFYKKSDFLAIVINFLTIIMIGGFFNYFFINKITIEMNKANIEMSEANTRNLNTITERLKSDTTMVLEKLTALEKQANIGEKNVKMTSDLNSIIKNIQPNVIIKLEKETRSDIKKGIDLIFDIKNIGAHAVIIDQPKINIATIPIYSIYMKDNNLLINKDYLVENMTIGTVPPGQPVQQRVRLKFKNIEKVPRIIYFYTIFNTKIDRAVTNLAQKFLINYITKKEVMKLASMDYKIWGESKITFIDNEN